jgi:hypothetical protein
VTSATPRAAATLLATVAALAGCGSADQRRAGGGEAPADPPRTYLAGDATLTVVDVATRTSRVIELPASAAGDPPYRIVRTGEKLVLWTQDGVYTVDPERRTDPAKLADASFFLPSATRGRMWVVGRGSEPDMCGPLTLREVTVDGRAVSNVAVPDGRWPAASVGGALVLEKDDRLEVWEPSTRTVTRVLPGEAPAAGVGSRLPWCSHDYATLHVTDVRTGEELAVSAPPGFATFDCWSAAFSPDGSVLAVPVAESGGGPRALALVDLDRETVQFVKGSRVEPGYVFVAWASSGDSVFISGGERFERRTLVRYRPGSERAVGVPVPARDFYGMAAG